MTDEEIKQSAFALNDLEFLLKPQPDIAIDQFNPNGNLDLLRNLGWQFAAARSKRGLIRKDLVPQIKINEKQLDAIERGVLQVGVTFNGYLDYAYFLKTPLEHLFRAALRTEKRPPTIRRCSTIRSGFRKHSKLEDTTLQVEVQPCEEKTIHSVRPKPCYTAGFRARQTELLMKTEAAIDELQGSGESVTFQAIADHVGLTRTGLKYYPEVKKRLMQVKQNRRYDEDVILTRMQVAVVSNEVKGIPTTQKALCQAVGVSLTTLRSYPKTRGFLDHITNKYRVANTQHRTSSNRAAQEQTLLQQVEEAIVVLNQGNKPISQLAISKIVGLSPAGLKKYPRVKLLLEKIAAKRHKNKRKTG